MIKHVLKDGSVLDDITGHVVKQDDAKIIYRLIDSINQRGNEENDGNDKN
jgi:hypothetical protein